MLAHYIALRLAVLVILSSVSMPCLLAAPSTMASAAVTLASTSTSSAPTVMLGNTSLVGVSYNFGGMLEEDFFGGTQDSSSSNMQSKKINAPSLLCSGIPYAESPVGDLRFAAPVPKDSLDTNEFDASSFGFPCPQPGVSLLRCIVYSG